MGPLIVIALLAFGVWALSTGRLTSSLAIIVNGFWILVFGGGGILLFSNGQAGGGLACLAVAAFGVWRTWDWIEDWIDPEPDRPRTRIDDRNRPPNALAKPIRPQAPAWTSSRPVQGSENGTPVEMGVSGGSLYLQAAGLTRRFPVDSVRSMSVEPDGRGGATIAVEHSTGVRRVIIDDVQEARSFLDGTLRGPAGPRSVAGPGAGSASDAAASSPRYRPPGLARSARYGPPGSAPNESQWRHAAGVGALAGSDSGEPVEISIVGDNLVIQRDGLTRRIRRTDVQAMALLPTAPGRQAGCNVVVSDSRSQHWILVDDPRAAREFVGPDNDFTITAS